MNVWTSSAIGAALIVSLVAPANAHTSYMLPNVFTANLEEFVTVESSFSEDFFRPEVAVQSDDFHVILPDGTRQDFETVTSLKQVVVLESPLEQDGTYRFSTGVRRGSPSIRAKVDGEWVGLREFGGEVPDNATETKTRQTETVADAYLTKKAPTRAPVDVQLGRLVIQPITHPSDAYLGEPFEFQVLFDGEPMIGQTVVIDRGSSRYDEVKYHEEIETGVSGNVSLGFKTPGVYLIMTRYAAPAPEGAETDERSYTTSLTLEIQR